MCRKRDNDERFKYPPPVVDTIDLTLDDDDIMEILPHVDQWNYNLLPSSDEEEPGIVFINQVVDSNGDVHYAGSSTTHDSSNEINENANTPSASVNINLNISETNDDTDQSNEGREFELNIPQILLSMSRISNNLYNQTSPSHE